MSDILDDFREDHTRVAKERHGCVSIWLVLMIFANSIASIGNLYLASRVVSTFEHLPSLFLWALAGLGVLNLVLIVKIFQWKKIGFFGILVTSCLSLLINIMLSVIPLQTIFGLAGLAILYRVLQLRIRDGGSTWGHLE